MRLKLLRDDCLHLNRIIAQLRTECTHEGEPGGHNMNLLKRRGGLKQRSKPRSHLKCTTMAAERLKQREQGCSFALFLFAFLSSLYCWELNPAPSMYCIPDSTFYIL